MSVNSSDSANLYLTIKIITPDASILEDRAEMITVPSTEGELGFLPAHLPMIFQIQEGLVKLHSQGLVQHTLFINSGYGKLHADTLTITCEYALDLATTNKTQNEALIVELNTKIEQLKNADNLQESNEYNSLQDKLNKHHSLAKFLNQI